MVRRFSSDGLAEYVLIAFALALLLDAIFNRAEEHGA